MSVGYPCDYGNPYHLTTCPWCNPLHIVVDTDASDEHVLARFIVWIFLHWLNTLCNRTAHEIWLIDLVTITDCSHVFLEGQRHPQAGLVRVFNHRQFLSSFWILVTIRVTVSSIRSSLGLLFKDSSFRPHWVPVFFLIDCFSMFYSCLAISKGVFMGSGEWSH